jgi:superfamily II DNA or RNA helicase
MPPFAHLEFHRSGIGLIPEGPGQDTAIYVFPSSQNAQALRSCTCVASKRKTCDHLRDLSRAAAEVQKAYAARSWEETFSSSLWYRLARLLFEGRPLAAAKVRVQRIQGKDGSVVRVTGPTGEELARYLADGEGQIRFLERTGKVAPGDGVRDRAELLLRLSLFQVSAQERVLLKHGVKTQRQTWEESFWYRLAYHCVRELEPGESGTFHPAIDEATGIFTLTFRQPGADGAREVVRFMVPRDRVRAALALLAEAYPGQEDLVVRPLPLRTVFHVSEQTELDVVEVRPAIQGLQEKGEERFLALADKFRYGNLVWVQELGLLAEIEREGRERKFRAPARVTLKRSQIPGFLEEFAEALEAGELVLDAPLRERRIFKACDRIEIAGADLEDARERSWYWLSIQYGFGSERISLGELLRARREGLPYLEIPGGWVDLQAPAFRELEDLLSESETGKDRVRLAATELLRLYARSGAPVEVTAAGPGAEIVDRLLRLSPAAPFRPPVGLATLLRPYQRLGVEWLRFLWENRLGGLLCDDMGLGKTLQTLTLMAGMVEEEMKEPFLVVCPTSVLPHWRDQTRLHAPGLRPVVHHGPQRQLESPPAAGDVLVTSYGVLRRDAAELSAIPFALAVFDEIQQVKNRQTQSWQAASQLQAGVRIGLTGTPIENALGELKTLFDLVLPGYFGSDAAFAERFGEPAEEREKESAREERQRALRQAITPFTLRRLKSSVLHELPEKIEDLRRCTLSEDQVKLYRDAVESRGAELARQIREAESTHLPYIHIFALLNLLKQICDHPALALGKLDQADAYVSGKWDLFREILQEALDSDQKVVVFSQFLGMVELMERHLRDLGVEHVVLTGASVNRGALVDRFNRDPQCRVFVGSLKAGGTGIDLVAGSVVIHYDRWWNAAREDQATDRVHRIGQKRAVQVVKLITEGTLEEKISAIIDRKRRMMESVVQEDDPHLAKIFTRDELLEMLRGG